MRSGVLLYGACDFYVYEHWRPDKNVCFYVGKGTGRRAYSSCRRNANSWYCRVITKLSKLGLSLEVRIVAAGLSEQHAFALEAKRIAYWRSAGNKLTNTTDGGEGTRGLQHSAEARAKISAANKGRKRSPEVRAKLSSLRKGIKLSEEHKRKIGRASRGRPRSQATKEKMRAAALVRSPEHIAKISAALKGRTLAPEHVEKLKSAERPPVTEATREKMRIASAVRAPRTPEHKARISSSIKAWHAERRQYALASISEEH